MKKKGDQVPVTRVYTKGLMMQSIISNSNSPVMLEEMYMVDIFPIQVFSPEGKQMGTVKEMSLHVNWDEPCTGRLHLVRYKTKKEKLSRRIK